MIKNINKKIPSWIWVCLFIIIGVLSRWVDHAPNITPIVGIALFTTYMWKISHSAIFTVLTLFLSNLIFGYDFDMVQLSVYIGLLFPSFVGIFLKNINSIYKKYISIVGLSLLSSTFFYVITNFAVWLWSGMYEHTINGLLLCYEMAIPFFRNTVIGDLFSSLLLFGVYDLSKIFIKNNDLSKSQITTTKLV